MAKNRLCDLNDHLFMALERLNDEDLQGDALLSEIKRTEALATVAREVIATGKLALQAQIATEDFARGYQLPRMLES
ncbi:hypothetical protein LJC46_02240 [Desulfovibrio sp. OttesenSCG-928-G15]|nr:hypothetical protein [Desulfovibrio sp. OttesenSCG-928-G15]